MDAAAGLADDEARLRDALRRAEQRFAAVVGNLHEIVFQTDLGGCWTFLNDAWTRLLGYPVDESIGTLYESMMHPADRPASLARLAALLSGESEECRAVFRMFHRDGSIRWFEIVARPLRDEARALTGLTGTLNDITERVAAEHELERARRRVATVVEGTGVGIWERDELSDVSWYSPEWAHMLGYEPDELAARHAVFVDLVHPDDLAHHQRAAERVYAHEAEFFENQIRMRHKDGHWVWVRSRGRVMKWAPDGTPLVTAGTHTEITDQVAAEQALRTAQKMEALGRIAGGIAHDFNNLLGVILGSADLIDLDAEPGTAPLVNAHAVEVIRSAAARATSLTDRLLDIARERVGPAVVIDLDAAADASAELIAKTLPASIELVREPAGVALPIEVDAGLLTDTLLNLALNARDAMPDGGRLTLRTEFRAGAAPAGDRVAVIVSDTGVGIAPDVQPRIFEPFFTTKPTGAGSGLGLALAYAFARQSGGDISLSSRPGEGASFVLEFPRSARPLADASEAATDEPPAGRGETVLVVDDEGLLRELARAQLEGAGYRVVLAADGPSALTTLDARPDIDLVFSDVAMPGGMSGFELAAAIRARYPGRRVVLTSGFASPDPAGHRGEVLRKPYTRAELLNTLRQALGPGTDRAAEPNPSSGRGV